MKVFFKGGIVPLLFYFLYYGLKRLKRKSNKFLKPILKPITDCLIEKCIKTYDNFLPLSRVPHQTRQSQQS